MWDPTIAGGNPGVTPVFNWLLWGYGVPALAFAAAAWKLGGADWARRTHESLALIFAVLLAVTEIRHAVQGNLIGPEPGLAEIGGYLCVALAYAIGLERLRRVSTSPVYEVGSLGVFAVAVLLGFAVLGFANPVVTGDLIEGRFVNLLLLAYAVPALLAFALNRVTRETRPLWHYRGVRRARPGAGLRLCDAERAPVLHRAGPRLGRYGRRRALRLFRRLARLRHRAAGCRPAVRLA